jgi:hypothetical protein
MQSLRPRLEELRAQVPESEKSGGADR